MKENWNFSFKTQVHRIKPAISALIDQEFNPTGYGRIDTNEAGLQITVFNAETRVLANLSLKSCGGYDEFIYNRPSPPRMVDLNRVFRYLALAADDDTVTFYHVLKSDLLSFVFGNKPGTEFSVFFPKPVAGFQRFPVVSAPSGVVIPSQHLWQMASLMSQNGNPQNVSVKMTEKIVSITVGENEWRYEGDKIMLTHRWEYGEELSRCFQLPHHGLLMYSSYLSQSVLFCCLDNPTDSIMLRFSVTETSDLTYITSATNLNPIYSFRFQLFIASHLKQALNSLTDSSFGQHSSQGMILANNMGLQIAVQNSETGVIGILDLPASGLINYQCKKPIGGKMVNVNDIANKLGLARDDDLVTVRHVDGSNEINFECFNLEMFKIGPTDVTTFAVELLEMNDELREWPMDMPNAFEHVLPSQHLREMIPLMTVNKVPQTVSLEFVCGFVSISVGGKSWKYDYNQQLSQRNHRVLFEWPQPEILQQASVLLDWSGINLLTDSPNSIVFMFQVYNAGYLAYFKKVSRTLPALEGQQLVDALRSRN